MIRKLVRKHADEMEIKLSGISLVDGIRLGCLDMHLLNMSKDGRIVSILVHQSDIDNLQNGNCCDRLELKTRAALSRLKVLLES